MIDSDAVVEAMIQDKGLTAPRVMPKHIDVMVASLRFEVHTYPNTTATVALAILPNGFVVGQGQSACVSLENYNKEIGDKVAIDNARDAARQKLWELEGYHLKKLLTENRNLSFQDRVIFEKAALDDKIEKLQNFMNTPAWIPIPAHEQDRLCRQFTAMMAYSVILGERIAAF